MPIRQVEVKENRNSYSCLLRTTAQWQSPVGASKREVK